MKSGKGYQEEEEEEEFGAKNAQPSYNNNRDGKNTDKASGMRSKHSVTEQRRRSKINERFQTLRELIPNTDQKKDTASFLLEVIEYVHYLQEKVQKYEGSYQGWSSEPTKLMPWRNSHWRVQSFVGHPQPTKNGSAPGSAFPGRFDDNHISITPNLHTDIHNPIEGDPRGDASCKAIDQQPEIASKTMAMPMPLQANMSIPVQNDGAFSHHLRTSVSDTPSTECPITSDSLNQQDELTIEGGTISISSVYSQELLSNLTQVLQTAGVDLSEATITVQIDLGKRANTGFTSGIAIAKGHENPRSSNQLGGHFCDAINGEDTDHIQKRPKI